MTNLIVAGIDGQGVNVLTRVLAEVLRVKGYECQYTVHKGGAQSLGTVYGEMRITTGALPILGAGIPRGKLDILVALDPWEALRHLPGAHAGTRVWVETEVQPIFNDRRTQNEVRTDPLKQLEGLPLPVTWRRYRRDALAKRGSVKMANYLAGLDCLEALGISDFESFDRTFSGTVFPARHKEKG